MTKRTGDSPLSRLGYRIKRVKSKKVVISFITIVIFIMLLLFCTGAARNKNNNSYLNTQENIQRVEEKIVNKRIQELQEQGYENVTAEEGLARKMAKENNIPIQTPRIQPGQDLEDIIAGYYDYFAVYYTVTIDDQKLLFKTQAEVEDFLASVKKYDNKQHEIETTKELVKKETEKEVLDTIVSTKKAAYEKALAEAEARRKAEEAKAAAARKQQQERQQSSSNSAPSASVSELQAYAHDLVINQYGWSEYDFDCLVKLWNRESGWNPNAHNKSSGAHGIPQSLPASKMASEGSDYYTNGKTQIRWGLKYIKGRYGSPSSAWAHSQQKGWY